MSTLMLVNPRPKRRAAPKKRRSRSTARRTRVTRLRANPRRRRARPVAVKRRRHVARMHTNPKRRRRMHRNPRGLSVKGFLNNTLMPASIGAGGALLLNLGLGYIPIPATLNNNFVKPIVGLLGAGLIGFVGSKVAGRRMGEQMAAGAAVVVVYGVIKNFVQSVAPALPLSGYNAVGLPVGMGEYVGNTQVAPPVVQPMGEYVGVGF